MSARRPVLPALAAVFAGALVAGAATLVSGPAAEPSADQNRLSVGYTGERSTDAGVSRDRPATSTSRSTSAPPAGASSAPPPTTTSTPVQSPTTTAPPAQTTDPAPPVTATSPDGSTQDQVVALTNAARQDAGCGPLEIDTSITDAAQAHASDMAARSYFEHTNPEGVTFDQRIRTAGYSKPGAENIAQGARTADDVVELWMNSPGHRANILNCDLTAIGVGLDRDGFYWVQDFGF